MSKTWILKQGQGHLIGSGHGDSRDGRVCVRAHSHAGCDRHPKIYKFATPSLKLESYFMRKLLIPVFICALASPMLKLCVRPWGQSFGREYLVPLKDKSSVNKTYLQVKIQALNKDKVNKSFNTQTGLLNWTTPKKGFIRDVEGGLNSFSKFAICSNMPRHQIIKKPEI